MRIVIREKADADLDGIYSWIEKDLERLSR